MLVPGNASAQHPLPVDASLDSRSTFLFAQVTHHSLTIHPASTHYSLTVAQAAEKALAEVSSSSEPVASRERIVSEYESAVSDAPGDVGRVVRPNSERRANSESIVSMNRDSIRATTSTGQHHHHLASPQLPVDDPNLYLLNSLPTVAPTVSPTSEQPSPPLSAVTQVASPQDVNRLELDYLFVGS